MKMGTITDLVLQAKAWWKSKTIIGVLIAFIPTILKAFGIDLDLAGIETEVIDGAEVLASQADAMWSSLITAFGTVLAIWGRLKAKVPIKGFASIPGGGIKRPND